MIKDRFSFDWSMYFVRNILCEMKQKWTVSKTNSPVNHLSVCMCAVLVDNSLKCQNHCGFIRKVYFSVLFISLTLSITFITVFVWFSPAKCNWNYLIMILFLPFSGFRMIIIIIVVTLFRKSRDHSGFFFYCHSWFFLPMKSAVYLKSENSACELLVIFRKDNLKQ